MNSEDRQQAISDLKALRAELLANSDAQNEGASGEDSSSVRIERLKALKEEYVAETTSNAQEGPKLDSARKELYEQYGDEPELNNGTTQRNDISRRR